MALSLSLDRADYEKALTEAGQGDVAVFHHQTTGSTNDDARSLAASSTFDPAVTTAIVVAEAQTRGRGRGSNTWRSPEGSIAFTITVAGVEASRLGVLPLGVGACVVEALGDLGAPAALKWPNDVLIGGRKVCGILCESSLLSGRARVYIGIGMNVSGQGLPSDLTTRATTLEALGLAVSRPPLVADITARVLGLIHGTDSNPAIVEAWKRVAVPWWGEEVTFSEGETEKRVTLLDVNPHGQLVVRDAQGVVRSLVSGEVHRLRTSPQ